jgi:hypothetical protein
MLFFCDFGCATWSLLDCRHPEGQMWWWEMGDRDKLALTLPQWLAAWLDGRIDENWQAVASSDGVRYARAVELTVTWQLRSKSVNR